MTGIMTPDRNGREGGTDNGHEMLSIPSDTTDQNNARAAVSIPRLIGTSALADALGNARPLAT
jgi:hypothetical protein